MTANDAGAAIYEARLFGTTDDGANWAPVGVPIDPSVLSETVEVAKSNPHRFYISAVKGAGATATGLLYVSDNDGASWAEHQVPLDLKNERAPFIAAVDPANADRIYVRTGGGSMSSRLLVSDDAGITFRAVYTGMPMLGFALSPDGSKVFLGGGDGLFMRRRGDGRRQRRGTRSRSSSGRKKLRVRARWPSLRSVGRCALPRPRGRCPLAHA